MKKSKNRWFVDLIIPLANTSELDKAHCRLSAPQSVRLQNGNNVLCTDCQRVAEGPHVLTGGRDW